MKCCEEAEEEGGGGPFGPAPDHRLGANHVACKEVKWIIPFPCRTTDGGDERVRAEAEPRFSRAWRWEALVGGEGHPRARRLILLPLDR